MNSIKKQVCICGGGPAGFMAAIAASRNKAETLILEKNGFLGGLATAGLVGPISKFNFKGERIVRGIPLEFIERLHSSGGAIIDLPTGNIPFDSELYKLTAQRMVLESGTDMLLHSTVFGVKSAGDRHIKSVLACSEGNILEVEAEVFIDCSGTGSLLSQNSRWHRKRNITADNQPLSLIFKLGGVDTSEMRILQAEDGVKYANPSLREKLAEAVNENRLSNFGGPWAVWGSVMREGQLSVNCTRYAGDVTDPVDFSRAELAMRKDIPTVIEIFRRADPAFRDCYLQESAATTGCRESRELIAAYRLTGDDIISGHVFPDTIAWGAHPVDRHLPGNSGQHVDFLDRPYAIPWRVLLSEECENLLAAGALAAAEPAAYASMRVQAQCMAMGQAAGTAAAMSAKEKLPLKELDILKFQENLSATGVQCA